MQQTFKSCKMKNKDLAKRVKELRLQKGYSQEELAEKSGLSLRTVQRIECGETVPREDSLKRLANVLDETTDAFGWTMKENRGLLMMTNFSAFSFILFPFLGIILPLIIWLSNKREIKNMDKIGRKILNFQITWLFILMFGFSFVIFHLASNFGIGNFNGRLMGNLFSNFELFLIIMYFYNFAFIIVNAFRIDKEKELKYFPSIPFFKLKK